MKKSMLTILLLIALVLLTGCREKGEETKGLELAEDTAGVEYGPFTQVK